MYTVQSRSLPGFMQSTLIENTMSKALLNKGRYLKFDVLSTSEFSAQFCLQKMQFF